MITTKSVKPASAAVNSTLVLFGSKKWLFADSVKQFAYGPPATVRDPNPHRRNCPIFRRFATPLLPPTRCRPIPLDLTAHPSIPSVPVVGRSGLASPQTVAGSDVLPPRVTSSKCHVLPAVVRSSPAVAADSSATSSRFLGATLADATDSPGCRPAGSTSDDESSNLSAASNVGMWSNR
jgi:hypothetical protein